MQEHLIICICTITTNQPKYSTKQPWKSQLPNPNNHKSDISLIKHQQNHNKIQTSYQNQHYNINPTKPKLSNTSKIIA
ncbi:hypothetical protein Leryth_018654 [Lithospermum erythrorhizon]|nr:hypothetical protein Leryth_018654 [Lithospermum erythrorhizon]